MSSWCRAPAPGEPLAVVHPGVAVALVPPADQQQPVGAGAGSRVEPGQVVEHQRLGQVDPLVLRLQALGQARLERAEVHAVPGAPPACGPTAAAGRCAAAGRRCGWGRAAAAPAARAGRATAACAPSAPRVPQRELAVDLPVVHRARRLGEERGGEPRGVAHREHVEDQVVVVALQRRGRRQDHVGVPGRLVEVEVDGDHEVQPRERLVEPLAVGGRQHRVAGDVSSARTWPSPGREDLVGEGRHRQLARELRQLAHPAAPLAWWPRPIEAAAHRVDRRPGEHHPAGAVEVAGERR